MSLHREIVIQEYFSLQRYPLMISRERYEFYFIIVEIIRSLPLGFFHFTSMGSPCKILSLFSSSHSYAINFSPSLTQHIAGLRVLFPTILISNLLSSRWSSTTSIRKSWIRAQTIKQ